jgi:hypothetical protein
MDIEFRKTLPLEGKLATLTCKPSAALRPHTLYDAILLHTGIKHTGTLIYEDTLFIFRTTASPSSRTGGGGGGVGAAPAGGAMRRSICSDCCRLRVIPVLRTGEKIEK